MTVERIHELYDQFKMPLSWTGMCHECDQPIEIDITPETEGWKIEGGAVYEVGEDYYLKCDGCYEKEKMLRNYQTCEVYSRVVGYLRPVAQWNPGKKSEFKNRKAFKI